MRQHHFIPLPTELMAQKQDEDTPPPLQETLTVRISETRRIHPGDRDK
jgi:hypothetical protein